MADYYAKYKNRDLWCIKADAFDTGIQNIRETQFALGNGYLGVRGILEEIPIGTWAGTYIAGVYDRFTSQVAELVNFPNPFFFKFTVKGEKVGAVAMDVLDHQMILNMQDGLLTRRTVYSDSKKRRYDYQSIRFVSMHDKNIGVMQVTLTPLDDSAEVEIQSGLDTTAHNKGTITEGNKRHFNIKELDQEKNASYLLLRTLEKRHQVIYRTGLYYVIGKKRVYAQDNILKLKLKKRQPIVLTKVFYIGTCGEKKEDLKRLQRSSRVKFNKAFRGRMDSLLKSHREEWRKLWDVADVIIAGTADIQKNLRFNIFHMLICGHVDKGFSSIGARTLSGEGYRGHVFWDAEIFMLPFYAYAMPKVAKNMLMYRYFRMDQARDIAKKQGYKGTMYPWESAGTGEEETPTWAKDLDGKIIRIKTNELEHHITADIAFACCHYFEITDDEEFMMDYGYEMVFEAARFWASRVQRNRQGKYEIRDVIGPDEFHEHVNNNAFTNVMAKWNLSVAHKFYQALKKTKPKLYTELRGKIGLTDKEVNVWKRIVPKIVFKYRKKDYVIEEFDGYFQRKHINIVDLDENGIPMLPKGVKVKDYNKTQFVKQADVLMLLYLLADFFPKNAKKNNYHFYAPRTLHKSSLSPAIHAIMALESGLLNQAYQFFNVALRADISNLHGNSHEGIHAASLGGVWQSVINGFAGVKIEGHTLSFDPRMPTTWQYIQFSLLWKGSMLRVVVNNNEAHIKIESKQKKKIKMKVFGKNHLLVPGKGYVFRRHARKPESAYY
ncbi:MAG: glycoside hydrolase family 65 protein [Candidatus Omnitrophica bacterium]|nr:glycoside hydrolase family 65 protein [Candidatus Omnitrophota bacterium]